MEQRDRVVANNSETVDELDGRTCRWHIPESAASFTMAASLVNRIQAKVIAGFISLPKRGAEVGGILLGRVLRGDPLTVHITDFEPVPCEYRFGPTFILSDTDLAGLRRILAGLESRRNSSIVGYYRSCTGRDLALDDADAELMRTCFLGPEMFVLSIKPLSMGECVAWFFSRQNGTLPTVPTHPELPFDDKQIERGAAPQEPDKTDLVEEFPQPAPMQLPVPLAVIPQLENDPVDEPAASTVAERVAEPVATPVAAYFATPVVAPSAEPGAPLRVEPAGQFRFQPVAPLGVDSGAEPAASSVIELAPAPEAERGAPPVVERVAPPVVERVAAPVAEHVAPPVVERVPPPSVQHAAPPGAEPVAASSAESVATPGAGWVAPSAVEPVVPASVQRVTPPVVERVAAPDAERADEPLVERVATPLTEHETEPTATPAAKTVFQTWSQPIAEPWAGEDPAAPARRVWPWVALAVALSFTAGAGYQYWRSNELVLPPSANPRVEIARAPIPPAAIAVPAPKPLAAPPKPLKATAPAAVIRQAEPTVPPGIRARIERPILVNVEVRIGPSGRVTDATVKPGGDGVYRYLAERAIIAAQSSIFRAARAGDGTPVASALVLSFVFTPEPR